MAGRGGKVSGRNTERIKVENAISKAGALRRREMSWGG